MKSGMFPLTAVAVASAAMAAPVTEDNMNGEYLLAPTPNGKTAWSTSFKDYPGGVESFEFYAGPVTSTYGEVFWTALPEVQLPAEIVQRFKGKAMAVVGFESDQVRKTPDGDVSLPINLAYNHHYGATLLGSGSKMERVPYDPNDGGRTTLLSPEPGWDRIPVEHTPSLNGNPTNLWCGYSNGGEYRKSYHGLPPPFVQVIESPRAFDMTPMQIDTWNRDKMNLTGSPFVPGPYPKKRNSGNWPAGSNAASKWPSGVLAPTDGVDATYSGLLECPLTTRIQKKLTGGGWQDSFSVNIENNQGQSCPQKLATAEACFAASKNISISASDRVTTSQGSSAVLPSGCSVQVTDGLAQVYFNTNATSEAGCGLGVDTIEGVQDSLVTIGLTLSSADGATITITGPADGNWFGAGFNTHVMAGSPYAIVIDGQGKAAEYTLTDQGSANKLIAPSVTVVSSTVANGSRTVVLARPLAGITPQHYSFNSRKLSLDFIAALGSTPTFGYHKSRTVGTLALWPKTPPASKGGVLAFFGSNPADGTEMRNDYEGEVGYQIVPKSLLTVTALGRAVHGQAALKASAAVNIWSAKTKKLIATAPVGPNASTPHQGFSYVDLATPVALQPGQTYYVTQTCTKGMPDLFTNSGLNADVAKQAMATLGDGVYGPAVHTFPTLFETTSQFAGIVTFMANVPANPHPAPAAACVCAVPAAPFGAGTGTIKYVDPLGKATSEIGFPPRCEPYPRETVLRDKNPTCDIRTYVGGLSTCHHGWHLLDADQEVPWQDQPLEYYFKWRFYFQEYDASQHTSAYGWNTGIGGNTAEYDVPQCAAGTPVKDCTHEISGVVTPPSGDMHFVGAHYHCHAPTCLKMEIFNNETGELLCREEPYHGQGADTTGGDRFDETGYIGQRICLWGNSTYGLEKPPKVSGVPLFIRAVTNSTYGHHGEMALPQMLVADLK